MAGFKRVVPGLLPFVPVLSVRGAGLSWLMTACVSFDQHDVFLNLTVVIISPCIRVSDHQVVALNCAQSDSPVTPQ